VARAVSEIPPAIEALLKEGRAHHQAMRLADAERFYRAALRLDPAEPTTLCFLGMVAGQSGKPLAAIELFERALQRDPNNADLHHNIGETYRHLGEIRKAHEAFRCAIALRPDHYAAYRSGADMALQEAERRNAAGQAKLAREYRQVAARYLNEMGLELSKRSNLGAEAVLREALALDPKNADIWNGLGSFLLDHSRDSEAEMAMRRAVALNPRHGPAYSNLGKFFMDAGRLAEAETAYRKALSLVPDMPQARLGLKAIRLVAPIYRTTTKTAAIFALHRDWGTEMMAANRAEAATTPPFANPRDPDRRIKLGYVSPDFRQHSVSFFFEPLLAHHDPDAVETYLYAELARPDEVSDRLKNLAGHWRVTTGQSDGEFRRQLRADGIDILIDLAGHTTGSRIEAFALRPAPVTVSWLGYPATTGLPTIDWRITDAIADPAGAEQFYTERLFRLENGFLCYQPPVAAPDIAPLPALSRGYVTFGSFNNLAKMDAEVIGGWSALLRALPLARLRLKSWKFNDAAARRHWHATFLAQGVEAERIETLLPDQTIAAHLGAYRAVDIALDPFPYNGTTTSCEALWMGVPVVSLIGDRHAGRVGLDLLSRVALDALAAPDIESYVATALGLAHDLPALARLRGELRGRMRASPLCDAPRFARDFEAALRQMWREWCEQPP
jgi:protein O-GlcNAc transferase